MTNKLYNCISKVLTEKIKKKIKDGETDIIKIYPIDIISNCEFRIDILLKDYENTTDILKLYVDSDNDYFLIKFFLEQIVEGLIIRNKMLHDIRNEVISGGSFPQSGIRANKLIMSLGLSAIILGNLATMSAANPDPILLAKIIGQVGLVAGPGWWDRFFSKPEIHVIGDIHGDLDKFVSRLEGSGLITNKHDGSRFPRNYEWTGGDNIVVQIGDMVDGKARQGGRDASKSLEVLELCKHLSETSGGNFKVILGNHEIMNMAGEYHYADRVHKTGRNTVDDSWKNAFDSKSIMRKWLENQPIVLKIGSTLYTHAGFSNKFLNDINIMNEGRELEGKPILQGQDLVNFINKEFKKHNSETNWLKGRGYGSLTRDIFHSDGGISRSPYLSRDMIYKAQKNDCATVEMTKKIFKVNHIDIGHTPLEAHERFEFCKDSLRDADRGVSSAFGFADKFPYYTNPLPRLSDHTGL